MRPLTFFALLITMLTLMPQTDALAATGGWIEKNVGQADAGIAAIARANQVTLLLQPDRARILLPSTHKISIEQDKDLDIEASVTEKRSLSLELLLHGANSDAVMQMGENYGGVSRYFRGQNPDKWLDHVAHYESVRFSEVYPGIDLVYRFNGAQLEYDFEVAADANVSDIRLELLGADRMEIDANGDWVARTAVGEFRQHAPEIFRVTDTGLDPIAGSFLTDINQRMSFQYAASEKAEALLIDPVIEFSGYIGGSGADHGSSIAMNLRNNLIVSGNTTSTDIPGAPPGAVLGGQDIYIAEIDTNTGALLWINYIGGSGSEWSDKMKLDSLGNIIAVGYTDSADFPAFNAFQSTFVGNEDPASQSFNWDAIVFKLSDDGSAFIFSTYYGGADLAINKRGFEWFRGIAIDNDDNIYATGQTGAPDFSVTDLFLGRSCMAADGAAIAGFVSDIALVKFAPDGTRLFATCIGGTERDGGRSVELGDDGRVYLGGFSRSSDLPTSPLAFQPEPLGFLAYSAFVLKLNDTLTDIEWGTYVGGSNLEIMQEIQVDSSGAVYGSGSTYSADYPVTINALQTVLNGGAPTPDPDFSYDGFVFKLLPDGTDLSYSSYLGGSNLDDITATFIDSAGRLYVAGATWSRDMLLETPLQPGPGPLYSRVDTLSPTGSQIQGLAKNVYFNSGGSGVDAALVARNGNRGVGPKIVRL